MGQAYWKSARWWLSVLATVLGWDACWAGLVGLAAVLAAGLSWAALAELIMDRGGTENDPRGQTSRQSQQEPFQ